MRDLRSIYVRANACVACHQVLDDQIAAAGHPPLLFELTAQMKNEPPHWRDLRESSVRTWLAGQASALRELSWNAALQKDSRNADDPAAAQRAALAWLLGKATALDSTLPKIPERADIGTIRQAADQLAAHASAHDPSGSYASNLFRVFASSANDFKTPSFRSTETLFYCARRLVLALEALTNDGQMNSRYLAELRQLNTDVAALSSFDANTFARDLDGLRLRLESER
jgi:hypothetical protein